MSGVSIATGVSATSGLPDPTGASVGDVVTLGADGVTAEWGPPSGGGGGAPTNAEYIVGSSNVTLTNERVLTNTTTITWDNATAGQMKANVANNTSTQKIEVVKNSGAVVGTRKQLNFIEGSNITLTVADDGVNDQVDITITGAAGGGVSDGDKGDITVTASGATWTIDNDVVTFAKMQNITTDRLLGRDTATTGDVEEITVGGGLEFTGTAGIQRSALTGDVTASAGSNSTIIPNNTVTYAKMQDISATDRLLGRDTAGAGDTEELTVSGGIEFTGAGGIQTSAFTGDATKTAGGTALTLATVNSNVGSFGSASAIPAITVNGKGLVTAVSTNSVSITSSAITDFTEAAQDAVGAALTDTNSINMTYNDAGNTITADVLVRNTTTANTSITASGVGVDVNDNTSTQKIEVTKNSGAVVGTRKQLNFIEGSNITLSVLDDVANDQVDITITGAAGGGGVSDGDKGDITVSSSGTVWTVDNDVITFAKMQNITTDRLLGRDTAATGDVEEITVGGGIEFTGTGGIQTSAFTGDATKTAGGTALTLATVNSNVGSFGSATQVGTFTVNAKGLITAASNTSISVTSSAISDFNEAAQDAVGGILTDTATVDFTYNDAGNQITADVINDSITDAKLRNSSALSVIGRSANSTGDPADIAASADGDVLRRSGTTLGFGAIPQSSVTSLTTDLAAKQPNIQFKDEGVNAGTSGGITTVDFVGAGVSASAASGTLTVTISGGGGGGGTPGGSDTHVQYNDAGSFGGEAAFTYNKTTDLLTAPNITITGATVFNGIISPTQLTADTNDWNPTSLSGANTVKIDVSKELAITGIQGGASGRILNLMNLTGYPIYLPEEDTNSTAANRFLYSNVIGPYGRIQLIYDSTTSRWTTEENNIVYGLMKMINSGSYL